MASLVGIRHDLIRFGDKTTYACRRCLLITARPEQHIDDCLNFRGGD